MSHAGGKINQDNAELVVGLLVIMGACGPMGRVVDSGLAGLRFDSHCWSCVDVSGKLLFPFCLCPPGSDGYLVEWKIEKIMNGISCKKMC